MVGFTTSSLEDILFNIRRIFGGIAKGTLAAVGNEWITRLEWIIKRKAEYGPVDSKKPTTS
jgi:hypothetical protein